MIYGGVFAFKGMPDTDGHRHMAGEGNTYLIGRGNDLVKGFQRNAGMDF